VSLSCFVHSYLRWIRSSKHALANWRYNSAPSQCSTMVPSDDGPRSLQNYRLRAEAAHIIMPVRQHLGPEDSDIDSRNVDADLQPCPSTTRFGVKASDAEHGTPRPQVTLRDRISCYHWSYFAMNMVCPVLEQVDSDELCMD
jgi:hypothetical protein